MTAPTPKDEQAIRKRAARSLVWEGGTVPRPVAEYLWDAVHDRHALLALLDAARAERDTLARHAQEVVDVAIGYAADDQFGVYPLRLFEAVGGLQVGLAAHRGSAAEEGRDAE